MAILYETKRLQAVLVRPDHAQAMLSYEKRNKLFFSIIHPQSYYTLGSFEDICRRQCALIEEKRMFSLLFFRKDEHNHICCTVQLNQMVYGVSRSAKIGYSVDKDLICQGYGKESVSSVIRHAFDQLKLHRIEAHIMPANTASLALASSVGFSEEGLCKSYLYINGRWEDHLRFSILNDQNVF